MLRFRFASRLPEGDPSYNLSVTFGDTSPCRRGLGIPQTSPSRQWLPYQGSWHREAMTERLYYMPRFRFASRFPGGTLPCVGTERFFQPQRRFILRHHLFFGPLLGLVEEAGGLFAGAEQLKVQRFIIRRGKHPLPCLVGDSLPRAEAKNQRRNQIL